MNINGETRIIGFFGSTYRTSKMYAMYNAAIAALGLNYVYIPFAVDNLAQAVAGVRHLGVAALGVTIPYKVDIIPYLDDLDEEARRIGAVNVVVNRDGRLIGGNTDGRGARRALAERTTIKNRRITLLGAGGTTRAIAFALHDAGGHLTILNRTPAHALTLAEQIGGAIPTGGYDLLPEVLAGTEIIINTTSVGMAGTPTAGRSLVPAGLLRPDMIVMDIVARPRETRLLRDAVARGAAVIYGTRMLLWQGVEKFATYTGVEPPVDVMATAMEEAGNGP